MKAKRMIRLLAAALTVSLLAGCGTVADTPAQTDAAQEEEPAETVTEEAGPEAETAAGTEEAAEAEAAEETEPEAGEAEAEAETGEETLLAAPSVNGALQVIGTQLSDQNGDPVQLRGVSTHGLGWFPEYVNAACLADLHDWGANVFRLALYTAESEGYCTGGDQEELKDLVRRGVEYATAEDMYVIVDWHILSEGSPLVYQAEAEAFFAEMSAEFADHDNVLYEICNEPNGGASWSEIKAYAQDIIPIIRANDEDAVIIVGTPTWSQDVDAAAADPIEDWDNIMYTLHFYAATHKEDLRAKMTAAIEAGLPIFVTEFGICDASGNGAIDEESADTWIDLMDRYGISYVMWNLSNKDESSSILGSSVSKTSGFAEEDLSQSGRWLFGVLRSALLGTSVSAAKETSDGTQDGTQEAGSGALSAYGDGLSVTTVLTGSWESNGRLFEMYDATVKNISGEAKTSWEITVEFDGEIELSDGWNGSFLANGTRLRIRNADYNGALADGESATDIGFIVVRA